jgi:di/tricarboxylate transporter
MEPEAWITVATLFGAVVLFITKWIPMEATALSIPVVLVATGTLDDPDLALKGFSNYAVIAIGAIFILGEGLKDSGVATLMARGIERVAGRNQTRTTVIIMVAVAVLSSFMSSAATVAVFLPAVAVLARRTQTPTSRLMMPLAYAAVLGGTLTLIGTTPNLILGADLAERTGGPGMGMFEFAKIGAPVTAVGILYMATIGRRFLPDRPDQERHFRGALPEEVAEHYGFREHLYRMRVVRRSRCAGRTIAQAAIRTKYDLDVVLIRRSTALGNEYVHPRPDVQLRPGDHVYLEGEEEDARRIAREEHLRYSVAGPRALERILGRGLTLAEVALAPRSQVLGRTFKELDFQQRWGLNVISVWQRGQSVTTKTGDIPLKLGDSFMVSGRPAKVRELARQPDYAVLTDDSRVEDVRRAPLAVGIMLLAVLPAVLGWMPLPLSAIGAAMLMIGTRCVTVRNAHRAIDWRVLLMIIGTIPLGLALDRTGVAARAAEGILELEPYGGRPLIFLCLFLASSVIAVLVNNGAAAVVLAPVAALAAKALNVPVNTTFLAVAIGASCAFTLPFGNQCCLMVMGPGGYSPKDYLRAGTGISILMTATTVILLTVLCR